MYKHREVFDIFSSKVGQYYKPVSINPLDKEVKVKIEKRRSFNPNVWSQINEELQKLEDLELIEDCPYPLISPANLVAAKRRGSDKIRLCVDYRRLNDEIAANFFPLPTTTELFSNFGRFDENAAFIQLDISSCFWNFPLEEKDRHLTCFYTEHGVKQVCLPFGVKSAPGIVQHALNSMIYSRDFGLHPKTAKSLFIDDNLCESDDIAILDLDKILTGFKKIGLKCSFDKCNFIFRKNLDFMGSKIDITDKGVEIKANPKNIEAITNLDTPKNQKEVQCFIGMCNWISNFIPGLHLELGPLYGLVSDLNKKENKNCFNKFWTDNIDKLFKTIKNLIAQPKTLSVPNYDNQFFIEVDSSSFGSGAVLYQETNDDKKSIAYASKSLSKQAKNYDNIHRETAGCIWALEKFSHYFCCSPHPIKVFTDNKVRSWPRYEGQRLSLSASKGDSRG